MVDISQIIVTSSRFTLDPRSHEANPLPPFKENEIIDAKVLKVLSGRSAELLISGRTITVKTHVPLSEGETIALRQDPSGETTILRLVTKEDPVRQLNRALADNMDRAGPYRTLVKLLEVIHTVSNAPEKTSPVKGEGEKTGPAPPPLKLAELRTSQLLERLAPEERLLIEKFVSVKTPSFPNKLEALFLSSEGKKFFEQNLGVKIGVTETLDKFVSFFSGPQKEAPKGGPAPIHPGKEMIVPKHPGAPGESIFNRPDTPHDQMDPSDEKMVEAFVQDTRVKWTDKVLTLLSANSDALAPKHPLHRDAERFLEVLFNIPSPPEKKEGVERSSLVYKVRDPLPSLSPLKGEMGTSLRMMADLVKKTALQSDSPDDHLVKGFIRNSGLSWENKLLNLSTSGNILPQGKAEEMTQSDLKGLALSMLSLADEKSGESIPLVRTFLDTLEELQTINRYAGETGGKYLIPFPVMANGEMRFGQLLIDLGKEADTEKPLKERVIKVKFILELSNLGDLRADFSIYKKAVTGIFGVGEDRLSQLVKRELPTLEKRLTALGYKVFGLDCEVVDAEILAVTTLTDQLVHHETDRVLNLVI